MKKLTKKQIGEFLGNKEDWEGYGINQIVIARVDETIDFYTCSTFGGISEVIYNGEHDDLYDFTDFFESWKKGYETKKRLVDSIYEHMLDMIEGCGKEL